MSEVKPDNVKSIGLAHQTTGRTKAAISGVFWSLFNSVVPTLSGFLVFVFASRVVSANEFGLVAFAGVIVGIASAIGPAGLGDAVIQRSELSEDHLNAVFWICAIFGVSVFLLICASTPAISRLLNDPGLLKVLPFVGARLIFDMLAVLPGSILTRQFGFRKIAIRTALAAFASLLVGSCILYAGFGIWALVFSQVISSIVICLIGWLSIEWRPSLSFSRHASADLLGMGFYTSAARFVATINIDQLFVGSLLGATGIGVYSFVNRIFGQLNSVLNGALNSVAFSLMVSLQNEPGKLRSAFLTGSFISAALSFPVFIVLFFVADDVLLNVFGHQWLVAQTTLQAFCAIGLLSCIGVFQSSLLRALGRADWWMWYQIAQQVLNAGMVASFASFGVSAVAIAIAVKTWIVWPVSALMVCRLLGLSLFGYLRQFLSLAISGIILGCVLVLAKMQFGGGLVGLVCVIFVGLLSYVFCFWVFSRARLLEVLSVYRSR